MTTLNKQLAMGAASGMSFDPEKRGKAVIDGFSSHLVQIREDLMKRAKTGEEIEFIDDEKPDDAMLAKLNGSGWRWAPSVMMWQRKRTSAAMYSAKEILEV